MSNAIEVEQLSKKYLIRHLDKGRPKTLRELLSPTRLAKKFQKSEQSSGDNQLQEDFWALKDVSFTIPEGERLGIIGGNGAGKSTLLKLLSRITEPTTGSIKIKGKVSSLLEVGTGFHPELTGRENIFLNGAILGMRRDEIQRKFSAIVEFSGVEKFLDTPVKRYSSGMYVRLAFAVSAWLDPDILIVDEVLSVGDMAFQKRCGDRMNELTGDGRTVLFVIHNMDAVRSMCDRAICLNRGEIVFEGGIDESIDTYRRLIDEQGGGGFSLETLSLAVNSTRGGSGPAKFVNLSINGRDFTAPNYSLPILKIKSGESLNFQMVIKNTSSSSMPEGLNVAFAIDSEFGSRIFTAISGWYGRDYPLSSNDLEVNASVQQLNLRTGRYRISISLILGGVTLDSIVDCAAFQVIGDQILGGIPFNADFGMTNFPVNFS